MQYCAFRLYQEEWALGNDWTQLLPVGNEHERKTLLSLGSDVLFECTLKNCLLQTGNFQTVILFNIRLWVTYTLVCAIWLEPLVCSRLPPRGAGWLCALR